MAASSLLQLPPLLLPLLLLPSVFAAPRALSSSRPSPAKCATALNQIASGPRLARSPAACSLVAGRQQALLRASNCSHEDISAFCGWLAPPRCVSRLVLVRHGEKSRDDSDKNLTLDGQHRAAYLARCAAVGGSAALALGAPTAIMASTVRPGKSHRPRDTVQPLATALGLSIDLSVDKEDPAAFAARPQSSASSRATALSSSLGSTRTSQRWSKRWRPRMQRIMQTGPCNAPGRTGRSRPTSKRHRRAT